MIGLTPPDRWTCPEPTCQRTVVPDAATDDEMRRAIRKAQVEHARRHSSAFETALRALDEQANAGPAA